jgi:hypothetical protein
MKTRFSAIAVMALVACAIVFASAGPASAHVAKDVGPYTLLVGWGAEPTYAGLMNSVQLEITTTANGKPYVDLTDTLEVTVLYGEKQLPLTLEPNFDAEENIGTPGDYRAWFIPTAPGDYTFHFVGTIGSQKVDESFTSSPKTFATVEDPAAIEFPQKAPSNVELAQRIDAESARTATENQVSSAKTLGYVGIAVGAVGIVLAAIALFRRRA